MVVFFCDMVFSIILLLFIIIIIHQESGDGYEGV